MSDPGTNAAFPHPNRAHPASPHELALDRLRVAISAEVTANNPHLAYPELEPDQYPDVWARLRAAQEALDQHLRDHRDVLGTHPRWQFAYELLDAPPESYDFV
ncbi:hypothetical protein IU443_29850 [Nocardia farcinica]|uniref:hypothetical protein n=1 Tax=Nocardia farcinica TaxID=37329 RepID=UPI001894D16F|nr:hypothetical protein [Nocardia farcinica]MBF6394136.1 hypothetical protein [Nocardia farcinica]